MVKTANNITRKLASVFLALVLAVGMLPAAAQTAAEAAGEAVRDFLARAVSEAAERDRLSRNS